VLERHDWVLADVEARLTEIRAMLGCLSDKLDALLAAFEPRGWSLPRTC